MVILLFGKNKAKAIQDIKTVILPKENVKKK